MIFFRHYLRHVETSTYRLGVSTFSPKRYFSNKPTRWEKLHELTKREAKVIFAGSKMLFEQGKEMLDPMSFAPRRSMSYRERRYMRTIMSDFGLGFLWVPIFGVVPGSPFIFLGATKYFPSVLPRTYLTARYLINEVPSETDIERCFKVLNIQREFIPKADPLEGSPKSFDELENQTLVTLILRVRENYDAAAALSRSYSVSQPKRDANPLDNILIGGKLSHFLTATDNLKSTSPNEILNMTSEERVELIDLLESFCSSLARDNRRVMIEYIHRTGLFALTNEDEQLSETLLRFAPFLSKKTLFDMSKTSSFYFRNDPLSECEVHTFLLYRLLLAPTDIDPRLWQYRAKEVKRAVYPRLVPEIDTIQESADGTMTTHNNARPELQPHRQPPQTTQTGEVSNVFTAVRNATAPGSASSNERVGGHFDGRLMDAPAADAEPSSGDVLESSNSEEENKKPPAQAVKPVSYADSLLWKEHVDKIEAYSYVRAYLKLTQVYSASQLLVAASLSKDLHISS